MNLLVEYNRRNNVEVVPPINEGLLFIEHPDNFICLVSNIPKSSVTCGYCKDGMILDMYSIDKMGASSLVSHYHIKQDTDILKFLKTHLFAEVKPVYISHHSEMEKWLWEAFAKATRLRHSRDWKAFLESGLDKNNITHQMFWFAMRSGQRFAYYYDIYQLCIVGRKYLLYG